MLYHGRSPWDAARRFEDLVAAPGALRDYVPRLQYALCDLGAYPDDALRGEVMVRTGLLFLRHIFDGDLAQRLPEYFRLLTALGDQRTGLQYLETLLRYVASAADRIGPEDLRAAIDTAFPEKGEDIMPTLAEKWIEEGVQRGIQQGIQQGIQRKAHAAVLEVLEARFGVVPQPVAEAVGRVTQESVLSILHKRAVVAPSLEDFAKDVQKALS